MLKLFILEDVSLNGNQKSQLHLPVVNVLKYLHFDAVSSKFFLTEKWAEKNHFSGVIMSEIASQITGVSIVCLPKKTTKLCATGLCEGSPRVTGGFHHKETVTVKTNLMTSSYM